MKTHAALLTILTLLAAASAVAEETLHLPWREAGLSEAEAAAHLLDRFAHGARPGEVERVVEMGLETWLDRQLAGEIPDPRVEGYVAGLRSLGLSAREVTEVYPEPGMVKREAARAGVVDRGMRPPDSVSPDSVSPDSVSPEEGEDGDASEMDERHKVREWARKQGYRPMRELIGELMVHKLYRAVYSENQLQEVLTDFYFNHFNVSITDNQARPYVPSYELDAIRPHVLGSFRDMLEATAKHPAMLHYLDNARSVAPEGAPTTFDPESFRRARRGGRGSVSPPWSPEGDSVSPPWSPEGDSGRFGRAQMEERRREFALNRPSGLNENYARELLELHTLGVDGGYTQDDVVEVARAFTGWATYPPVRRPEVEARIERARRVPGFVFEESFLFRADAHDAAEKRVLGKKLPAGRGIEDGYEVLDLVAAHPSTAQHLARKLAARFVADEPSEGLVERLAGTYLASRGDLREMIVVLASSPEFWSAAARRQKIKSPFEVAVSALRILDARITHPRAVVEWISRMGQPLYAYQAPTGYPDRADAWVNAGSLLNRMNFGLELATGRVAGVRFNLAKLNQNREPESLVAALRAYVPILLPERDPEPTVSRLEPIVRDPELATKVAEASPRGREAREDDDWDASGLGFGPLGRRRERPRREAPPLRIDGSPLAHVVGVILGSPEFQRR